LIVGISNYLGGTVIYTLLFIKTTICCDIAFFEKAMSDKEADFIHQRHSAKMNIALLW